MPINIPKLGEGDPSVAYPAKRPSHWVVSQSYKDTGKGISNFCLLARIFFFKILSFQRFILEEEEEAEGEGERTLKKTPAEFRG